MTATHRAEAAVARRPVTPAGRYLRATATNERVPEVPGPPAAEIFERVFAAVVRLRFRPDTPLITIATSVAQAARRHPELRAAVREAEMLIRHELGERVPTGEIPAAEALAVHVLMVVALVDELALTDDELDELIAGAEGDAA
jgi:hypothetical protein